MSRIFSDEELVELSKSLPQQALEALDSGETLTDTFTFTAPDGTTEQVSVTIHGAEDAPLFDSTAVTTATEDSAYSYSITTSDVDIEAVTITATVHNIGGLDATGFKVTAYSGDPGAGGQPIVDWTLSGLVAGTIARNRG